MKDLEVFYPNDDDPRKDKDPLMEIDAYLEAKTKLGEEVPTVQYLAEELGISILDLRNWLKNDSDFQQGLEELKKFQDEGLTSDDPWHNRVDVGFVRLHLMQTKNRHEQ